MDDRRDSVARLGEILAVRPSRRGFLRFAGLAAAGLGISLNGGSLAWAASCIGCSSVVCGCLGNPGDCCLAYADGSCGTNPGTMPCTSSGCDPSCLQQSWNCCYAHCRWICAECCCSGNGCSCAIQGNVSCGGGTCAQGPAVAA